jgi:thiamine kinase-like enzyme
LIDWEFAAIGDPFFDLATIAEHHHFDQNQSEQLLDAYLKSLNAGDVKRLHRYREMYNQLKILWQMSVVQLQGLDTR